MSVKSDDFSGCVLPEVDFIPLAPEMESAKPKKPLDWGAIAAAAIFGVIVGCVVIGWLLSP